MLIIFSIFIIGAVSYAGVRIWKGTKDLEKAKTSLSKNQEKPKINEINTSGWKIYRNEEYRYTLKYPPYLTVDESPNKRAVEFKIPGANKLSFIFTVNNRDCNTIIKATLLRFDQGKSSFKSIEMKREEDSNHRVWDVQKTEGVGGKRTTMFTDYNAKCYLFDFLEDYKEIGQKMIESITFLPVN